MADDLTLIHGIAEKTAAVFVASGVDTFDKLAALTNEEVERIEERIGGPGFRGRIDAGNWRDQANILAARRAAPPNPADVATYELQDVPDEDLIDDEPMGPVDDVPPDEPQLPPPDPMSPLTPTGEMMEKLREQIAASQRQIEEQRKQFAEAQKQLQQLTTQRPTRAQPVERSFARVMLPASEGGRRYRLNPHKKFSDIVGFDPINLPLSVTHQQVVDENGENRVAYFDQDGVQRYFADGDDLDIDLSDVEPPHRATVENCNLRHWLEDRVEYDFPMVRAAMKERFSYDAPSIREAKKELHRLTRTNR
jgi:hypothetical protein